jgi:hypothetical protein
MTPDQVSREAVNRTEEKVRVEESAHHLDVSSFTPEEKMLKMSAVVLFFFLEF